MGRRRGAPASSLDLLLDTICNTFGGVLFLAILTVILLQMSGTRAESTAPTVPRQAELAELESRREDALARLKTLRAAAAQQDALREQLAPVGHRELATTLRELRARRDTVDQERLKLLGDVSQAQMKINEVSVKLAELDRVLNEDREKLVSAEEALKREAADRTEDGGPPVLHDTDKDEIPLLLIAGRLHVVYRLNPDGSVEFNQDDCLMTTSAGQREVSAKPGQGVSVEADGASSAALTSALAPFEKGDYYLAVFVWPDSFAHFRELKEVIVRQGYEYRLVPLPHGEKVYMGAKSNVPVKVQ